MIVVMTVGQLAEQLGITLKEAIALCVVSGVQVASADTTLTPADVARVHDVLEGRVHLPDPKLTQKKKLGARDNRVNPVGGFLTIGAVILLIGGCVIGSFVLFRRGDTRVLRAAPGDCFDAELMLGAVVLPSSVKVVSCDGPHKYRAFGTIDLDETYGSWPGVEKITEHAQNRCPTLAGAARLQTRSIIFIGPGDEALWNDPSTSHKIICAAPQRDWDRTAQGGAGAP